MFKKNASLYDASLIDREKIYVILRDASWAGHLVMRLHDGDPNIYGATKEQVDKLQADGITCKMIPGVTSLLGACCVIEYGINVTWEYSDDNYYESGASELLFLKKRRSRNLHHMARLWPFI